MPVDVMDMLDNLKKKGKKGSDDNDMTDDEDADDGGGNTSWLDEVALDKAERDWDKHHTVLQTTLVKAAKGCEDCLSDFQTNPVRAAARTSELVSVQRKLQSIKMVLDSDEDGFKAYVETFAGEGGGGAAASSGHASSDDTSPAGRVLPCSGFDKISTYCGYVSHKDNFRKCQTLRELDACKQGKDELNKLYKVLIAACSTAVRDIYAAEKSAATAAAAAERKATVEREAKRVAATAPGGAPSPSKAHKAEVPHIFSVDSPHRAEMDRIRGTMTAGWDFRKPVVIASNTLTNLVETEKVKESLTHFKGIIDNSSQKASRGRGQKPVETAIETDVLAAFEALCIYNKVSGAAASTFFRLSNSSMRFISCECVQFEPV